MFILYLVFMLGIGIWFFMRSKDAGEKDYFLGGREMGAWVSGLSAGASDMSAWVLMGMPASIYAYGMGKAWIPVGLFIGEGVESAPLVTRAGPGNFGLLPNGVFCWGRPGQGFRVIESRTFAAEGPDCRYATQSGPMLVIGGKLHPRFLPDSDSVNIRNGVGVSADGRRAVFAVSNDEVNFHRFARFFRDHLGLPDALYFDGNISRLYAPALGRHDGGFPMGPIVGTVTPKG